jgi:hypothetical protein
MTWAPAFRRNLWLAQAVTDLRPHFYGAGLPLPKQVLVTTGSTLVTESGPALGQCTSSKSRADRLPMITIHETLSDRVTILAALVHELIHAADDCQCRHGAWFTAWAMELGLVGPAYTSLPSTSLRSKLESVALGLGPYPQPNVGFNITTSGAVAA